MEDLTWTCHASFFFCELLLGEKLHELLLQNGSMNEVNVQLEQEHIVEEEDDAKGGWHTEGSLKLIPGWTPC